MSHHDLIKKLSDKLENWDYQLDRLQARVSDYEDEAKAAAESAIEKLKAQEEALELRVPGGEEE